MSGPGGLILHPAFLVAVGIAGFLLFFALLWLGITALLGLLSGWRRLEQAFPDRAEPALARLSCQTGAMGGGAMPVSYRNCLHLDVCATGLRCRLPRVMGPFQQAFLVPWDQIRVTRRSFLSLTRYELVFGTPAVGSLVIPAGAAERIAAISPLPIPG